MSLMSVTLLSTSRRSYVNIPPVVTYLTCCQYTQQLYSVVSGCIFSPFQIVIKIFKTHFMSTLCPLSLISGLYGHHLNVMDWTTHELIKRIDLGPDGRLPLEIRFLHDPTATEGYVGCALSSTVFRFFRAPVSVPAAFVASIFNTREA